MIGLRNFDTAADKYITSMLSKKITNRYKHFDIRETKGRLPLQSRPSPLLDGKYKEDTYRFNIVYSPGIIFRIDDNFVKEIDGIEVVNVEMRKILPMYDYNYMDIRNVELMPDKTGICINTGGNGCFTYIVDINLKKATKIIPSDHYGRLLLDCMDPDDYIKNMFRQINSDKLPDNAILSKHHLIFYDKDSDSHIIADTYGGIRAIPNVEYCGICDRFALYTTRDEEPDVTFLYILNDTGFLISKIKLSEDNPDVCMFLETTNQHAIYDEESRDIILYDECCVLTIHQ